MVLPISALILNDVHSVMWTQRWWEILAAVGVKRYIKVENHLFPSLSFISFWYVWYLCAIFASGVGSVWIQVMWVFWGGVGLVNITLK